MLNETVLLNGLLVLLMLIPILGQRHMRRKCMHLSLSTTDAWPRLLVCTRLWCGKCVPELYCRSRAIDLDLFETTYFLQKGRWCYLGHLFHLPCAPGVRFSSVAFQALRGEPTPTRTIGNLPLGVSVGTCDAKWTCLWSAGIWSIDIYFSTSWTSWMWPSDNVWCH